MINLQAFIERRPASTYFALAFAISWGVFFIAVGPGGFPVDPEQVDALLPVAILSWMAGPSVAGLLMTGIVHGRAGCRELLSRLLRWRIGARWYGVALLTAPLLMTLILLLLSLFSPAFLPGIFLVENKAAHLLFGMAVGATAGFFEELGWTGFAVPELRRHYSVFGVGLLLGLVWAAWHLLPAFWLSSTVSGPFSLTSYLLDPLFFLVAFRVLMVDVYDRTGSLLAAMLMHMSLTASARIFSPVGIVGAPLLIFDLVWAAVLWAGVAAIARASNARSSR